MNRTMVHNLLLVAAVSLLGLAAGEYVLRLLETSPPARHEKAPEIDAKLVLSAGVAAPPQVPLATGVNAAWFGQDPPPLPKTDPDPEVLKRRASFPGNTHFAYTEWNVRFLQKRLCEQRDTELLPPDAEVYTFDNQSVTPRFRLLRGITTHEGMTINSFGFRGAELAFRHPANTIRIAFIGGSTTISDHKFPWSYPEHIIHWLNLWSQSKGLGVRFEGINSGRYSAKLEDQIGIVQHELLPLQPDLLLYYEGYNDFELAFHAPAAGLPKALAERLAKLRQSLERHSALARRLKRVEAPLAADVLTEPAKPEGRIVLPQGFDPQNPDYIKHPWNSVPSQLDVVNALAKEQGVPLVISSFLWMVQDGMRLNNPRDRQIHQHLASSFPNISYKDLRFCVDLHNNMLKAYARRNNLAFIDTAAAFPYDPLLFTDAIHLSPDGNRVQAWVMLQQLLPTIETMLAAGYPKPASTGSATHPTLHNASRTSVRVADFIANCPK